MEFYRGRRVLVTGGLGFLGSNLARRLVDLGADVLIVIVPHGGAWISVAEVALHMVKRRPGRQRVSCGRVTKPVSGHSS